jgi:hypothetical protein
MEKLMNIPDVCEEIEKIPEEGSIEEPSISTIIKSGEKHKKSVSLVKEVNDYIETWSYLNEKKNHILESHITPQILKFQQQFTFKIELTPIKTLIEQYFLKFGEILFIRNNEVVIKYEDLICLFRLPGVDNCNYIDLDIFSENIENIYKMSEIFRNNISNILRKSDIGKCELKWYLKIDHRTKYYNMLEYLDDVFYNEAYPYIDCENFIKDYLNSEEPILVLIGPPGTGKTKLIRQILKEIALTKEDKVVSVLFTSVQEIIEQGEIYLDLIFGNSQVLVLEDIDFHLKPRSSGNYSLYSLLSVSSGLLSNSIKSKKIILSTNLPNVRDIDDALLRPGRCFEILKTRRLSKEQAEIVAKLINKKLPDTKEFTLAEIYNS